MLVPFGPGLVSRVKRDRTRQERLVWLVGEVHPGLEAGSDLPVVVVIDDAGDHYIPLRQPVLWEPACNTDDKDVLRLIPSTGGADSARHARRSWLRNHP